MLFLLRHSLELGLKANILYFETRNNDIEKIRFNGKYSHSIEFLYDKFTEHIDFIVIKLSFNKDILEQLEIYKSKLLHVKNKLHSLDSNSICFRYPIDKKGKNNFDWNTREDLLEIVNLYYDIQPFILYTSNVFDELSNTKNI